MRAINLTALLLIAIAFAAHAQQSAPSKSSIASKTVLVHLVVLDQSGAVIPSAEVVFKGESGIVTAHPDSTATVNVNLPTGKYVVLVSVKGFLTSKVEDYSVLTQSAAEFRVVLKVDPNNLRGDEFVEQPQVPIQSAVVPQFIAETAQAEQKKSGGSICVLANPVERPNRISPGGEYNPATLMLRIDRHQSIHWPHKDHGRIDNLKLDERHRVILTSDGKPIQSFWFKFSDYSDSRLCIYFDGYQGVQLGDPKNAAWCKAKRQACWR